MSYSKKTLLPSEQILFHTRLHWIIFTSAAIWALITLFIFIFCSRWSFFTVVLFTMPIYVWLGLVALFITFIHSLKALTRYFATEYAVTNKRVLMQTGLLRHKAIEIFLTKVESVYVTRHLLGRLLHYGTITISGSGGHKEPFPFVANPMGFRKAIHEQLSK